MSAADRSQGVPQLGSRDARQLPGGQFHPGPTGRLGIAALALHGLRHHAATRMLQRGIDIKDISLMLERKSVRITQDMYISHQASALDRISTLI